MTHVHQWIGRNNRFRCVSCGVYGYRAIGSGYQRGAEVLPFRCQHELAGRKHCGRDAVVVSGNRQASRCAEHAPQQSVSL